VPRSRRCGYTHPLPNTPSCRIAFLVKHRNNFTFTFTLNTEAACSSETSVDIERSTRHYNLGNTSHPHPQKKRTGIKQETGYLPSIDSNKVERAIPGRTRRRWRRFFTYLLCVQNATRTSLGKLACPPVRKTPCVLHRHSTDKPERCNGYEALGVTAAALSAATGTAPSAQPFVRHLSSFFYVIILMRNTSPE
jgi:hypothetical protein